MTKGEKIRLLEKFVYVNDIKFMSGFGRSGFKGYFNNSFARVVWKLRGGFWDWRDSIAPGSVLLDIFYVKRKEDVKYSKNWDHYHTDEGYEFLRFLRNVLIHFNDTERKRAWDNRQPGRKARTQEQVLDIILSV
ncbi:uncharacterized protein LOC131310979 [Rhododendron vialii]|uniref:uncharacterized protein LOC131310979 n=1 Tax=Rhododendron vialii TaxID=182163 RepID=UPI00265DC5F6|nr:uncharacterized protein LOC131310979 [Rhododendron vialii]